MHFEWDPVKNEINIAKHGIDFADIEDMFYQPMLTLEDTREAYGEARWIGIGVIKTLVGVVVYTERCGDVVRIISARKATRHEVRRYEYYIEN